MAENESKLRGAASDGDVAAVERLLAEGVKQTADEDGETPLHFGTSSYITDPKYAQVVRALLEAGGDVNAVNNIRNMPIHNAASNGNLEIVELLVNEGADIHAVGEAKTVPLGLAALKKHHAVVNVILKKLLEDDKFTADQIKWASCAETETQQVQIYRALSGMFQEKQALPHFLKHGIMSTILDGMKKFSKKSIATSGLQLLGLLTNIPEGVEQAKKENLKDVLSQTVDTHSNDPVVAHLVNEVLQKL